jgi:hypothetical protein
VNKRANAKTCNDLDIVNTPLLVQLGEEEPHEREEGLLLIL